MGQKVNPFAFRMGVHYTWNASWYARKKDYSTLLVRDLKIRQTIQQLLGSAAVEGVNIIRPAPGLVEVIIRTARPGIVIGKKGEMINSLTKKLTTILKGEEKVSLKVYEVAEPDLSAQIIADNIVNQLLKKVHFRRAMKRAIDLALEKGVQGIRVECKGRLAGAEIARKEWYQKGRVPRNVLRSLIDYGASKALTKYGMIGVKVWLYKGDLKPDSIFSPLKEEGESAAPATA